jgi:hypothetical protein
MMTVFAIPQAGVNRPAAPAPVVRPSAPPRSAGAPAAAAPTPTAAPAAPAAAPVVVPTTGNPCIDVAYAYILQSQMSPEMVYKCAMQNYGTLGTRFGPKWTKELLQYQIANADKLPHVPDQDVPFATREVFDKFWSPAGFSGLGQVALPKPSAAGVVAGLAVFGILWAVSEVSKRRR